MNEIVLQKRLVDDVIGLLEEYDKIESDYYDELINKTPVKDWGTLSEKAENNTTSFGFWYALVSMVAIAIVAIVFFTQ